MRADETSPATTSNLDQQMKQVADIKRPSWTSQRRRPCRSWKQETPAADTNSADLLPEDIQDRAYPDTPVKELDTTTIVDQKLVQSRNQEHSKGQGRAQKKLRTETVLSLTVDKTSNTSTTRGNLQLLPL